LSQTKYREDIMAEAITALPKNIDQAANQIGKNITDAQSNLMAAYSLKEGADQSELKKLATALGMKTKAGEELNVKTIQLVAEQRFQQSTSVASLFSNLLEKLDQIRQQIINNIRN
jgi:hypothetical protein